MLSITQKNHYQAQGFLIINDFFSHMDCITLIDRAHTLINEFDDEGLRTIFSASNPYHERNRYFLESGEDIRFFFEENAFTSEGNLKKDKLLSINKIGHALHDLDPVFSEFSQQSTLYELCQDLCILEPLLLQSMYICKQPFIGGEVSCHQDSTYLFVEPHPVTGFWFALEDATLENGCLWAIPGGHHGLLKQRMVLDEVLGTRNVVYDPTPWDLEKMHPLPVKRGSLIVLHGLLPHMSKENKSSHSRHAYTLHLMSANDRYAADNWLQLATGKSFSAIRKP